jgi:hypothetical protein
MQFSRPKTGGKPRKNAPFLNSNHPRFCPRRAALLTSHETRRESELIRSLFLYELPEFDRHVLEVLREPLELDAITISRAARRAEFPARFQLIATMKPRGVREIGGTSIATSEPGRNTNHDLGVDQLFYNRQELHQCVMTCVSWLLRLITGERYPARELFVFHYQRTVFQLNYHA